jgi:hypothetical protein
MATKDITDKRVCEAYAEAERQRGEDWENDYQFPYIILQRMTGQPEKVCYRAIERAAARDYIEFGVSLRTGWLTDKGKALLEL